MDKMGIGELHGTEKEKERNLGRGKNYKIKEEKKKFI
jgi:hypothetical protein